MKQKHYHLYVCILSVLLLISGGLTVYVWYSSLSFLFVVLCLIINLLLIILIWKVVSFIPEQVKYFLGSLLHNDTMNRFPETRDPELHLMYQHMNKIMQTYGQCQIELETKRLYYDRILRIMTHELRNSITPIISVSEDMLKRKYSDEDSKEAIEVINEQCSSIKQFLDSYYELTHLPKPIIKEIDAKSMLLSLEKLYPNQNIDIQCAQDMKINCDEAQIKQILINLIKNSIEAFDINCKNNLKISIVSSLSNGNPRITVSDNGPGIPIDKQEEIFLPFYTSKSNGSGIGLAFSRQIMILHKGSLTCSSNDNGGAMFIMQF